MEHYSKTNMPKIFQSQVEKYGEKPCVGFKNPATGKFEDISWNEMNTRVRNLATFLISQGIKKGDRVAVFSANRPEWWISDLAILSIGAVNVPIYATNSAEETKYVIEHSGSKICISETIDHLDKVIQVKKKLPNLKKIISIEDFKGKKTNVVKLEEAYAKGEKAIKKGEIDKKIKAIKSNDMATIIYTSGTTGDPKGVMLSHQNFAANTWQVLEEFSEQIDSDGHILLSFLPLSHSLERTAGYYLPMSVGAKVVFAEDFSKVVENLQEVRPTFMISVPRLYEKIHSTILSRLPDASIVKKLIFSMAMSVAKKNLKYECTNTPRKGLFAKKFNIFDKLVFSKIKEGLGMNNLTLAVSGGAPLAISDAEFFIGMGIRIFEGFGLTETTPITNVNRFDLIKPGTIGPPMLDTELKISDEGELLVKGPQVMLGYYKNKKATAEAFTKDGYFKTGDIATFDEDNYYMITGRIKDIIVTAGGKNISPQNIEGSIKGSPYIEQIAIIGDKRKYLSALVIPAFESLEGWCKSNGVNATGNKEIAESPEILKLIDEEIKKHTVQFARVEQIRNFTLLDAEWTQETGELTPSIKIKRRVLEEKYKNEIEAMYPQE